MTSGDKRAVGAERLHRYWVAGPGLKRWASTPTPWESLFRELRRFMPERQAKATTSAWHYEVFHQRTGSDAYRVEHGGKMRGERIGKG